MIYLVTNSLYVAILCDNDGKLLSATTNRFPDCILVKESHMQFLCSRVKGEGFFVCDSVAHAELLLFLFCIFSFMTGATWCKSSQEPPCILFRVQEGKDKKNVATEVITLHDHYEEEAEIHRLDLFTFLLCCKSKQSLIGLTLHRKAIYGTCLKIYYDKDD